tara:strand:+ start:1859 stop:2146 length:288 start_codon:yes stop_codon:yes gene_type:complete
MDNRFLNKVLDQIVRETIMDYDQEDIQFPFGFSSFNNSMLFTISFDTTLKLFSMQTNSPSFSRHCKDVYGLNEEEIQYVWDKYVITLSDKIKNNG